MKTIVVLSVLVTFAIAAPAQQNESFQDKQFNREDTLGKFTREKKSPTLKVLASPAVSQPIFHHVPGHIIHKKPIIVKKKFGYHLYRNSEEEQADPQENCTKQVKVKLCDTEATEKLGKHTKNTVTEDNETILEDEMQQSIKMAKQAVENIQRDLHDMEHGTQGKMAQWKHKEAQEDSELQENIELARQALEHIENNFGNLETMNLHATALREGESLNDIQFKMAKSDEEKMAQWKQAMANIERNVEIAKNIEDSFKNLQEKPLKQKDEIVHDMNIKAVSNKTSSMAEKQGNSKIEQALEEKNENDMKTSASEPSMSKTMQPNHNESDKASSDITVTNSELQNKNTKLHEKLSKAAELIENHSDNEKHNNRMLNAKKLEEDDLKKSDNVQMRKVDDEKQNPLSTPKQVEKLQLSPMRLGENTHSLGMEEQNVDTTSLMKSAEKQIEPLKTNQETQSLPSEIKTAGQISSQSNTPMRLKDNSNMDQNEGVVKNEDPKNNFNKNKSTQNAQSASGNHAIDNSSINKMTPSEKTSSNTQKDINHIEESASNVEAKNTDSRWALHHDDHENSKTLLMKAADHHNRQFHSSAPSQDMALDSSTNGHKMQSKTNTNHFNLNRHDEMSSQASELHEKKLAHGKSADMEGIMTQKLRQPNEPMMRKWNSASRGAYGTGVGAGGLNIGSSGSSGSAGAVGVFPNANVGGCAIPLLLSCSPSVVSGSLAKSPSYGSPSYGASSYRVGDDFNFHNKREANKSNDILVKKTEGKLNRIGNRSSDVLETKG